MTDEEIIERGFVPWKGGKAAPNDWDGGEVLARNGETWEWDATDCGWVHTGHGTDFIGYRRKQSYPANLTPELAERMVECAKNVLRHFTADGLHKTDPKRLQEADVASLRTIIAKLEPEPDPLFAALCEVMPGYGAVVVDEEMVGDIRTELAKRNLKIVESTHD